MVLVSTSILCAVVRLVRSSCLLDQLVHFLLRTTTRTELLLQRCNHISDQVRTGHGPGESNCFAFPAGPAYQCVIERVSLNVFVG